jgi:phosphate transport system substrate-binding protein
MWGDLGRMLAAALGGLALSASPGNATEVRGAGSTFVTPVMVKWAADYASVSGDRIAYQSAGSSAGIAAIEGGKVDFGASDMPLTPAELAKSGLAQFPIVIGGVVPVVNIEGVAPGRLRFTGAVLARIFLGQITRWSDPQIVRLNPGLRLPDAPINVVHRADGSGTTFNWTNYLGKVSAEWRAKVGEGTSVSWPVGTAAPGNDGVAQAVATTPGSIGYVEYAYAKQKRLAWAPVQNSAGRFISPGAQSFQAAAAGADWYKVRDFYLVLTNSPGQDAYPITATTYVLMPKKPKDANALMATLKFFTWALEKGQNDAAGLDYVPLPRALAGRVEGYWTTNISGAIVATSRVP